MNTTGGSGRNDQAAPVPVIVNETKAAILAVMQELGRPVSASELHAIWGGVKSLSIFDYHLSMLVSVGVVELVIGPELRFCSFGQRGTR